MMRQRSAGVKPFRPSALPPFRPTRSLKGALYPKFVPAARQAPQ